MEIEAVVIGGWCVGPSKIDWIGQTLRHGYSVITLKRWNILYYQLIILN